MKKLHIYLISGLFSIALLSSCGNDNDNHQDHDGKKWEGGGYEDDSTDPDDRKDDQQSSVLTDGANDRYSYVHQEWVE